MSNIPILDMILGRILLLLFLNIILLLMKYYYPFCFRVEHIDMIITRLFNAKSVHHCFAIINKYLFEWLPQIHKT